MGCRSPVEVESSVLRLCEGGDRASCAARQKTQSLNRRATARWGGTPRYKRGSPENAPSAERQRRLPGGCRRREREPTRLAPAPAACPPPPGRPLATSALTSRGVATPAALAATPAGGGSGRRHGAAAAPPAMLPAVVRREAQRAAGAPLPAGPQRRVSLAPLPHDERGAERPRKRPAPQAQPAPRTRPPRETPRQAARGRALSRAFQPMGRRDRNGSAQRGPKGGMRNGEGKEDEGEPSGSPRRGSALIDLSQQRQQVAAGLSLCDGTQDAVGYGIWQPSPSAESGTARS